MEGTVNDLLTALMVSLPLDTVNAVANTVTAVAVLWAARSLRRSLTEVRFLDYQPPLSLSSNQRRRIWSSIQDEVDPERERGGTEDR
jgi:hypothetical protein